MPGSSIQALLKAAMTATFSGAFMIDDGGGIQVDFYSSVSARTETFTKLAAVAFAAKPMRPPAAGVG